MSYNCQPDTNLDAIGWYCGNSSPAEQKLLQAHEIGLKQANAFSLFDMSGNASEWTNDLFDPRGYGDQPLTDPIGCLVDATDLTPDKHPVMGDYADADGYPGFRISRGGSYDMWSFMAMSGHRNYLGAPGGQFNGFRLVRTASKDSP